MLQLLVMFAVGVAFPPVRNDGFDVGDDDDVDVFVRERASEARAVEVEVEGFALLLNRSRLLVPVLPSLGNMDHVVRPPVDLLLDELVVDC